jgi:hypothetical protein
MKAYTVKIQLTQGKVLIYDQQRSFIQERELDEEVQKKLRGRRKAYFNVLLHDDSETIKVGHEVHGQTW